MMNFEEREVAKKALEEYAELIGKEYPAVVFEMVADYATVSREELAMECVRYRALRLSRDAWDAENSLSAKITRVIPTLAPLLEAILAFRNAGAKSAAADTIDIELPKDLVEALKSMGLKVEDIVHPDDTFVPTDKKE